MSANEANTAFSNCVHTTVYSLMVGEKYLIKWKRDHLLINTQILKQVIGEG